MTAPTSRATWHSTQEFNRLDEPVAEAELKEVYSTLADESEERRLTALRLMARDEYALSDAELREFTGRRLRAWLQMPITDATLVATSYDRVIGEMPANVAMRRVAMESTVLGMSFGGQERLRNLLSSALTGMPLGSLKMSPSRMPASPPKRRRWNFWRGSD